MRTLKLNNDKFEFFQYWNELSRKQLLTIAKLVQHVDFNKFNVIIMLQIFGFKLEKKRVWKSKGVEYFNLIKGRKKYLISANDMNFITSHFKFLFIENKDSKGNINYAVNSRLTKNLIKSFRSKFTRYYGPSDALTNLKFIEYIHTETHYNKFIKYNDPDYLDKLIAILYRKKKPFHFIRKYMINYDGDKRRKFNDFFITRHAKKIKRMDKSTKLAITWYYEGSRKFITERFPNVFSGSQSSEASNDDTFSSFLKLVNSLAEGDVTKNEKVRSSLLYEIMISMEEAVILRNKQKEMLEKQKQNRR